MSLFGAINIAGSGVNAEQTWLDTIGSNIANANDISGVKQPQYQEQEVLVAPKPSVNSTGIPNLTNYALGDGVQVTQIVTPKPNGVLKYDPNSTFANKLGMVKEPGINLGTQLGNLVNAQYSYEANASVMSQAKAAYLSILGIVS
ncbi:MAG: flagellar basal body rod protein FlgC [Ferrimicrobium sp.]|uniref:Flagellar basal body rod protein FlgC n=1 Tax=Ferrimicrobium acidiphilum TaxID=121039 RepID=A0ABV3XZY1_9ACTN|nr:flagellar basal body protein [Actinomycetota bacterium]